jgi:hypothetical protein
MKPDRHITKTSQTSAQMGNGASLVPERCQNSAEPLERNKRLAERN